MKKHQKSTQLIEEQKQEMEIMKTQAIKLAEIGEQLRQKRLEESIALSEIAVHTMIRVQMLQAIEEGKLERLPEPVYIQGLLLRYANALGFDGRAIAEDFPVVPKKSHLQKLWLNLPGYFPRLKLRPVQIYLMYLVAIVVAVQALSQHLNPTATQTANKKPEQTTAILLATDRADSPKAPPATPAASTSVTANQAPENQGVQVGLTLKDSSWVLIEADGKTEFEGMLPSGTERTWSASEKLIVLAGNAGGVLLAVNNGQAEQMGAPGEVIEREVVRSQP